MKKKFLSKDYKEELAILAEQKGYTQQAENLLLSMCYKIDESYGNYQKVKRVVPEKNDFMEEIVHDIKLNCDNILIAEPHSDLEKELKANKCTILTETSKNRKNVISYPNEKTLLYGISKASLAPIDDNLPIDQKAILTAVNIGRCISKSEVVRDFNGWSWSIMENEIESTECNIIYVFLSILLGDDFFTNYNCAKIQRSVSIPFYNELRKVATQFYMSYDRKENENILKKLAEYKDKLKKMKNQSNYVLEVAERKKNIILEIKNLDELLNNSKLLREQYLAYNEKMPDEQKVFSVSHYEEKVQNERKKLLDELDEYNRMQNPKEYIKEKERIEYEIKFYEEKTDISKLQKSFCNMMKKKIDEAADKKDILNLIYEIRYLNFLPNCKMKLNELEEKIIPKAISENVIFPISNNDTIDYRILKGIFESQVISLEDLYIKLRNDDGRLIAEFYDDDMLDQSYQVDLPEGSMIEIRKSKRMKIFSKIL